MDLNTDLIVSATPYANSNLTLRTVVFDDCLFRIPQQVHQDLE